MHPYTITSPSIDGLLTHDDLYFEGIKRPLAAFAVRDAPHDSASAAILSELITDLERYFNDVHQLFLKKLAEFSTNRFSSPEETLKLQALLQEIVKVKELIVTTSTANPQVGTATKNEV